ncbi:MAG: GNAT family N-acetyltransferase [Bradymonadia bacterium]
MNINSVHIRLLTLDDLEMAAEHLEVHSAENAEGDPYFMPYDSTHRIEKEPYMEKRRPRWSAARGAGQYWERMWGLFVDGQLVGHVDLNQAGMATQLHRVNLGVGLLKPWRGQGHGRRLTQFAIDQARALTGVDWLDLGVFAANTRAVGLYHSLGFKETGRVVDVFRLDGISIDDIQMTLWVGDPQDPRAHH